MKFGSRTLFIFLLLGIFVLLPARPAYAYFGPGAGMAIAASLGTFVASFFVALLYLISWPVRAVFLYFRNRKAYALAKVKRVVVLGLDGMDPDITQRFMDEGLLPHFKRLREEGTFRPLQTSFPAISPVAWSCFQTGSNPAKHNIFDFLSRDPRTYLPNLSSADIGKPTRTLNLGKYTIPLGGVPITGARKGKPFWVTLGEHGIFGTVLRVPITFPVEKFYGHSLAAMCVPDLVGSQGTFSFFSTGLKEGEKSMGGMSFPVKRDGGVIRSELVGPDNSLIRGGGLLRIPFTVEIQPDKRSAILRIGGDHEKTVLKLREYSPWITLTFKAGLWFNVRGIARVWLKSLEPEFEMYVTPINIDPSNPVLPISYPKHYATYLAKKYGSYATLGLAEDTWGLEERILDEKAFLEQTYDIHEEREKMFFGALEKNTRGLVCCVFDTTDRVQHMFLRYLDEGHPSNRDKDTKGNRNAIRDLYVRMDDLLGRVLNRIRKEDALIVLSDHGFKQFKRGININAWLLQNGYMVLRDGKKETGEWFDGVDWEKTRAYAIGLGGFYLNLKGREAKGTVEPGVEAESLKKEISGKLAGLKDPQTGQVAIRDVFDSRTFYTGPYLRNAPDLIIGYSVGYRISWDGASGIVNDRIFEDNTKSWCADHCVDPRAVPGILFSNRKFEAEAPRIIDIAPTVLDLFGVSVPSYMDGKPLQESDRMEKTEGDEQASEEIDSPIELDPDPKRGGDGEA